MHLIYTIADLQPESGGPARSVPALASAVAAQNTDVSIVTLDYHQTPCSLLLAPMLPPPPVRTTLVPCRGTLNRKFKCSPHFKPALLSALTSDLPQSELTSDLRPLTSGLILHDNGLWLPTNHAAAHVARIVADDVRSRSPSSHRIKFIISPRGMLTTWALKFRGLKKRIAWHLYQRRDLQSAHVLHATSRDEADGFRALGLTQPIAIVPNGVELPEIRGQRSEIRDRKLTSDPPPSELTSDLRPLTSGIPAPGSSLPARTALFLSRIHPKKGLFDLVAAWGLVRPKGWRVVIAGGSENGHQADLESAIRERGLGDEFQFLGEVPDDRKWGVYRSADLFILPTKSENFGIVIAEALGSGVPVITTKGTPWEELQTHRCGWWVDPNAEALAGALREACALSPEERSAMGERGRKLIESKYTWPAAAAQMLAVYRWMLSKGERPECVV